MNQNLKPNDLVYVPSETSRICRVTVEDDKLFVDDGYIVHHINEQGYRYSFNLSSYIAQTFAFLATPETKERLEQVYGKLEDIPPNLVQEFENALHDFYLALGHSEGDMMCHDAFKAKIKLIEMFKNK